MPKIATYHIPDGTVIRHIKDWKLHMPLGLITREVPLPQSKAVQAFSSLLKQAVTDA
jgi:LysR family transcriptional regulator, regulator of the ytmI operon